MKRVVLWSGYYLLAVVLLLFIMELGVRIFSSNIATQGTDSSLFQEGRFGITPNLKPNAQGCVFGKKISVDENGFLQNSCSSKKKKKKVLFIGDSVTMGVGIESDATFSAKLQNFYCDSFQIDNLSLIGYNINDYERIITKLKDEKKLNEYEHIVIFWCLNDNYLHSKNAASKDQSSLQTFLLSHSYLYCWLVKSRDDASMNYFNNDYVYYEDPKALQNLNEKITKIEKAASGKKLSLIMFPYECQLRNSNPSEMFPQRILSEVLKNHKITTKDCSSFLKEKSGNSKNLYLYGDGIHFSEEGHQAVFEYITHESALL